VPDSPAYRLVPVVQYDTIGFVIQNKKIAPAAQKILFLPLQITVLYATTGFFRAYGAFSPILASTTMAPLK